MSLKAGGALSRFIAADGFFLSAGLAFFFLVCLIPVLLLAVAIVGFVLSEERAAQEVVRQLTRHFPVYQKQITRALLRIVETRTISGMLGTAVLVLFATPLLSTARLVLHRLLGVKAGRNFLHNLVVDAGMVVVLGVLLFAASAASWLLHGLRDLAVVTLPVPAHWFQWGSVGLSLTVSFLMFYLAYRFVPRRHVRPGAALAGALLASLLWEIAKQLFRLYIRQVGLYDQIYGPLGVLVAFVMFVYYTAIVFVFSAAFVAALEARR
ncbi:MAG: YihY/virulence factor BrkB family protein [Candidatus Rokubacteria bacterium]|nr:YihY/virulence factor BrkB family protein [Candidatus Rokubacteria bacterium]